MLSKEGSTEIVNVMTSRAGNIVLGRGQISHIVISHIIWRIFSSKLLRQLILKEPQFFYFFLYGVYVQDDIKMYKYEAINSILGSFNFFNKRELVQEMHEVPKGIEYDVRHRNRHVTVLNQSDNALYDITTMRHKNTFSVSNIFY